MASFDDDDEDPIDGADVYEVEDGNKEKKEPEAPQPLFQIYKDARIAVGKAVGPSWKRRYDAAVAAYEQTWMVWNQVLNYYNNIQDKAQDTPRGTFKRGDGTENVIYSNINVMLPAVYSKDPNITCTTVDEADQPMCDAMQALINVLMRRKDILAAKYKIKRAAGFALLTNFGVFKLDYTKKDDSREMAVAEMKRITAEMAEAKTQQKIDDLYGQLSALEMNMENLKPSGPGMSNVLPFNLIVDPNAEQPDGLDGQWMIEKVYLPTNMLKAWVTKLEQPEEGDSEVESANLPRVLVYKPTHKAAFISGEGNRDDGLGVVMKSIDSGGVDTTGNTSDERQAFIEMYFTECFYVWDKATRRVMLFHRDDWTWPLWVWDDPLGITRFFPYFILSFGMSTGGTVAVGETGYILDQQDEINDINRQISKIRRTVFNFFYYNSDKIDPAEAEKFIKGIRGELNTATGILGVKAGDGKIADLIETLKPPSMEFEALFSKENIMQTINRVTNTNDALRGVQFKSYTNEASVESYQESLRLSVGAKVDVIEDVVSDFASALAELCAMNMDQAQVEGFIGKANAAPWTNMGVEQLRTTYDINLVAGSMEKPNSVFKKKEAIQVAQAVGQFANAAPGATLMIMLDLMEKAFTDINIKKEHWDMLRQEVNANIQKGISTGGQGGQPQPGGEQQQQQQQQDPMVQMFMKLPPEEQQKVKQMREQGIPAEEIIKYVQSKAGGQQVQPQQSQQQGQTQVRAQPH